MHDGQIDPESNLVVKTFASITELQAEFKFTPLIVKRAIAGQKVVRDFRWAYAENNVQ